MSSAPICVRCQQPVEENAEWYDVFEQRHWLCFHLDFEHQGDPDRACSDPSCPWWVMEVYRQKLEQLGVQPEAVLQDAIASRWGG